MLTVYTSVASSFKLQAKRSLAEPVSTLYYMCYRSTDQQYNIAYMITCTSYTQLCMQQKDMMNFTYRKQLAALLEQQRSLVQLVLYVSWAHQ
jgi:hypothetical protein